MQRLLYTGAMELIHRTYTEPRAGGRSQHQQTEYVVPAARD